MRAAFLNGWRLRRRMISDVRTRDFHFAGLALSAHRNIQHPSHSNRSAGIFYLRMVSMFECLHIVLPQELLDDLMLSFCHDCFVDRFLFLPKQKTSCEFVCITGDLFGTLHPLFTEKLSYSLVFFDIFPQYQIRFFIQRFSESIFSSIG